MPFAAALLQRFRVLACAALACALSLSAVGCVEEANRISINAGCEGLEGEAQRECLQTSGMRLTVLHTSDWHSRLLPYDLDVLATDERLGLLQANEPFGGVARMAYAINRERANAERILHVDSGDCFQGAPIFNEFLGEIEVRAMNEIGIDAFVIGNHEFDNGIPNLVEKLGMAQFPVLAANYVFRDTKATELVDLGAIAKPYTVVDLDGLRVGVIGMANFSSLSSISYGDNGLGIVALESVQTVQAYVDLLRPQVNVILVLTHLGLGEDEDVIRNTEGVDIIFGGHLHVVLNPPSVVPDKQGRLVPLVHSGAFMKYLGRLDTVLVSDPDEPWNKEVASHFYTVIPIDSRLPEDPDMLHLVTPYEQELARAIDLRKVVAYTPETLRRFGASGGDSPLGNFLADAMLLRKRVEADISATNSLGIRADINRGEITIDQMYNVFPFPNAITTMTLSGNEVQELLDFNTFRSAGRGCATQLQVAGVQYELDCDTVNTEVQAVLDAGDIYEFEFRDPDIKFAKNIRIIRGGCSNITQCENPEISTCSDNDGIECNLDVNTNFGDCRCRELLQPGFFYRFATNDYMARGGSGFRTLRFNTTQSDTGIDLREAVIESFEAQPTCTERCQAELGAEFDPELLGKCSVLQLCVNDLGLYNQRYCEGLSRWSVQDYCLEDQGAGQCVILSDNSAYDVCLTESYVECQLEFYSDDVRACAEAREAQEGLCASQDQQSAKAICAQQNAPGCLAFSDQSDYDDCVEFGQLKAELECPILPCPESEQDFRQIPIQPRNEAEGGEGSGVLSKPDEIMEELQAAGEDACY